MLNTKRKMFTDFGGFLLIALIFIGCSSSEGTLEIKSTGVQDKNGNIAASGKTIPITATETTGGHNFGVVGNIKNGNLTIKLPPVPDRYLSEYSDDSKWDLLEFANVELTDGKGDVVIFLFFDKPTLFEGAPTTSHTVKGWNMSNDDYELFTSIEQIYARGYRWVLTE